MCLAVQPLVNEMSEARPASAIGGSWSVLNIVIFPDPSCICLGSALLVAWIHG